MRQTKAQKIADARINDAYNKHCAGIAINMMDIGRVFAIGHVAIAKGLDDDALGCALRVFALSIRQN